MTHLMTGRHILLVLLVILAFLAGCGEDGRQGQDFRQGISEVEFRLLDNAPPERIYPRSQFTIVVEVHNLAAYDVADGELSILGLNDKYFLLSPAEQDFSELLGRSLTNPGGDKVFLQFTGVAGELFQNAEEYVGNYFLKASYRTRAEFTDSLCVNPSLYEVYDSGCKVERQKTYGGQGAPLAVSRLEEIIVPGEEVELRLTVANRGRGKAGSVLLSSARLGTEDLACEFQDAAGNKRLAELRPERQEAVLICRHPLRGSAAFMTTISLEFLYDYEVKQQHRLRLVK